MSMGTLKIISGGQTGVDRAALEGARRCYDALLEDVGRIKDALKQIAASISSTCQELGVAAERKQYAAEDGRGDYVLVESVIGPEHFPRIYQDLKKKAHPRIERITLRPPKDGLAGLRTVYLLDTEATLNEKVFPAVEDAFRPQVERLDILAAVQEYAGITVRDWIADALKQCRPFCSFDPVKVPGGYFSATYIGVPDEASSEYRRAVGDVGTARLVSTGNYNEIRIYSLMTALPAYAVSGIDRNRQVYEEYCSLAKQDPQLHVHIDRRWTDVNALPDLFPEGR